jgi:hypothetical protein
MRGVRARELVALPCLGCSGRFVSLLLPFFSYILTRVRLKFFAEKVPKKKTNMNAVLK